MKFTRHREAIIECQTSMIRAGFLVFIYVAIFIRVEAQELIFRDYTVEDGIPQSNANDIIQDNDGYLWFATQKGVTRFDGKEFFTLTETDGLISNIVLTVFQDSRKRFWFGARFGLSLYDNKRFTNFTIYDGLPSNQVNVISEGRDAIWIGSQAGVSKFSEGVFSTIPGFNSAVNDIFPDDSRMWIGADDGLYVYQNDVLSKSADIPDGVSVNAIKQDSLGRLWVATESGLYCCMKTETKSYGPERGLVDVAIEDLLIDSKGNVWLASESKGLSMFDGSQFHHYNRANGLNNSSLFKVFEDQEMNIWVGGRNGLTLFNRRLPFEHYGFSEELKQSDYFGMLQCSNNDYWFTTYGDGLIRFDGQDYHHYNERYGLPDNRFFDVIEDQNKNLWFASASGVIKYDGEKFISFVDNGLPACRVFNLDEDKRGDIWMATQEYGAVKFNGEDFEYASQNLGIPGRMVLAVYEDSKGSIWISSVGSGIYKFSPNAENPDIGEVTSYRGDELVNNSYIRCITEDPSGGIWLGSASHGVIRIVEGDSIQYMNIREKDGLKSDNIYMMMFDGEGKLWVGTEKGLDRLTFDSNYHIISVKSYQKPQGFTGLETTLNGCMIDRQGSLWFGTISGVVRYMPEQDLVNQSPPRTHIKKIKLFYKDTDWKEYSDSVDNKNLPVNLALQYDKNHLTFEFIGICLSNPEQVRYQFMLEGFDKTWSPMLSKNEAVYTSLPPGKYNFKVKASNDDLIWNEEPVAYAFVIHPPVWQKSWFIIIALTGIFGAVAGAVRWRIYELKQAKQKLEKKVIERTIEISRQNEKIRLQKEAIEKIKEEIERKNMALELQNEEIANQRDVLSQQKAEIEVKNNDITASIGYAQRIQNAMLPSMSKISQHFKDIFILFKPKAIVSGDFYWFSKRKNKIIIATVDCTGHGIPGAFMAMIGDSLLNQIVNQNEIIEPAQILKRLHEGVRNTLNQRINESADGMDIALCVIDKDQRVLKFAGAKSSLMYFENGNQNIIKGDRNPIGSKLFEIPAAYKTHIVPITGQTRFYIYTDGYQDQFGGENDQKFMIKRFKKLLHKIHSLEFEEQQKQLDAIFEKWKAGNDQIDDILVIGFSVL